MMNKFTKIMLVSILVNAFSFATLSAQKDPEWDDTSKGHWSPAFEKVSFPSTADGNIQNAYIYKSRSKTPKPLIVCLHTWSGNYTQKDPMAKEILSRDWNYIHPDFRGPNNTPQAMGSSLVISDIEDAIRYALENTNSNPDEVHIIGVSGGGYATLLAYMNIQYPVKSFSAWAPISDIKAWYWESVGRQQKYAGDIFKATSSDSIFNKEEALKRSPIAQKYPKERRKDAKLFIYEGIHDGYTGSVPMTHSIHMYNRLVGELKYNTTNSDNIMSQASTDPDLVSEKEIISLVTKRINPEYDKSQSLFGRSIHLFRKFGNIQLTIFEGKHEQISQALGLIPVGKTTSLKYNILAIGDSNGQSKHGWVEQLKSMMPESRIINNSQSGRTIGFDNNGRQHLNALRNINTFLDNAQEQAGKDRPDYVIVCLGTNDTKKDFAERQGEVIPNFSKLLDSIKSHKLIKKSKAKLIFVTPPPVRAKNIAAKFEGGSERLNRLIPELKATAAKKGFEVIDIYHPLLGVLDYYATDGIHMAGAGQEIIAARIIEQLGKNK